MRYLILSDMHGNWEALKAVLDEVSGETFDAYLVLGDLVGYGAAPNQVVESIRDLPGTLHIVRGNHDKVVAGIDSGANFNTIAFAAARWTAEKLLPDNHRYVLELPKGPLRVDDDVCICHGSPLDEDAYVFSDIDAAEIFDVHSCWVTFFGHTHIPSVFSMRRRKLWIQGLRGTRGELPLEEGVRYLINPGSIGQPRDRDPRAAYMIYDSERQIVSWHRVAYEVPLAQQRLHDAELPPMLAERLAVGI